MLAYHRPETLDGNRVPEEVADAVGNLNIDRMRIPAEWFHSLALAIRPTTGAQWKVLPYIETFSQR